MQTRLIAWLLAVGCWLLAVSTPTALCRADNVTTATCNDPSIGETPQGLLDSKVMPFVDLTVKGWLCEAAPTELHSAPEVELLFVQGTRERTTAMGPWATPP